MWEFSGSVWEQDDSRQTFRLQQLSGHNFSVEPSAPLDMLAGAKKHKVSNGQSGCTLGVFPAEFDRCPYCGAELAAAPDSQPSPWIPPYGSGTGLKILPLEFENLLPRASAGESLAAPASSGRFSFCSALLGAKQRVLIALQRDVGKLSVYNPDSVQTWRAIDGRAGSDDLPEWSWSMATDTAETGLAIPGTDGPAWITIDWAGNTLYVFRGAGRSIGGTARLGKYVLAPVLRGDDFHLLYRYANYAWAECSTKAPAGVVATELIRLPGQTACLGIPIIDESRGVAYWPARGGYVRVCESEANGKLVWDFRPWETDAFPATALIELGPPYYKVGARPGFWQLCEDKDPSRREGFVYKIIKFDGDEQLDSEVLEYGQFVSTGRASFSWLYDFWTDIHHLKNNSTEHIELRFPLLQFGEKGPVLIAKVQPWPGRESFGLFSDALYNKQERATVQVRFVIEGAGLPEIALCAREVGGKKDTAGSLFPVPLSQLAELTAFIYRQHLYIYFPEDGTCFGWLLGTKQS